MKLSFVADVHVGNHKRQGGPEVRGVNRRCEAILEALHAAAQASADAGDDHFICAGDLLDSTQVDPRLIARVQEALRPAPSPILLVGNHEQVSDAPGDHSLAPLAPVARVVDRPELIDRVLYLPFRAGPAHDHLDAVAAEWGQRGAARPVDVLVVHYGVRDKDAAPWEKSAQDAADVSVLIQTARDIGAKVVVAGNWHNHVWWVDDDVTVIQVGALVPTGFNNPSPPAPRPAEQADSYGSVVHVEIDDCGKATWSRTVIPGPRFVKVVGGREQAEAARAAWSARGCDPRLELTVPMHDFAAAAADSAGSGIEVIADKADAARATAQAAAAARSAASLGDVVRQYVASAKMPDGVSRDEVATRALRLLAQEGVA